MESTLGEIKGNEGPPLIPTMPGKLFFLKELTGPLEAECN